jgi:hypothetical protein
MSHDSVAMLQRMQQHDEQTNNHIMWTAKHAQHRQPLNAQTQQSKHQPAAAQTHVWGLILSASANWGSPQERQAQKHVHAHMFAPTARATRASKTRHVHFTSGNSTCTQHTNHQTHLSTPADYALHRNTSIIRCEGCFQDVLHTADAVGVSMPRAAQQQQNRPAAEECQQHHDHDDHHHPSTAQSFTPLSPLLVHHS